MSRNCPNCGAPVPHDPNGCILESLIAVVRDRGDTPEDKLLDLWAECDTDRLWLDIGPVADDLEAGLYKETDE